MSSITTINPFDGKPHELEMFIEDMDVVHNLLQVCAIDTIMDRNIWRYLICRMTKGVLMEIEKWAAIEMSEIRGIIQGIEDQSRDP